MDALDVSLKDGPCTTSRFEVIDFTVNDPLRQDEALPHLLFMARVRIALLHTWCVRRCAIVCHLVH